MIRTNEITTARGIMYRSFRDDPDFKRGYIDNIACVLMDDLGLMDKHKRDQVSERILDLIFEYQE